MKITIISIGECMQSALGGFGIKCFTLYWWTYSCDQTYWHPW